MLFNDDPLPFVSTVTKISILDYLMVTKTEYVIFFGVFGVSEKDFNKMLNLHS